MTSRDKLFKLQKTLEVGKDINGKIYVSYKDSYIKDGYALCGIVGRGYTFEQACEDYYEKISGKTIVFHAFDEKYREEITVL